MRYHIYWQDKILLKDLDEDEFKNIWEKMHWVYHNELTMLKSENTFWRKHLIDGYTSNDFWG